MKCAFPAPTPNLTRRVQPSSPIGKACIAGVQQPTRTGYATVSARAGYLGDLLNDLLVLREPAGLVLAPDPRPVHVNVKHSASPGDQLRFSGKLFLNRLRQTGGSGQVVSVDAILDANIHRLRSPHIRSPWQNGRRSGLLPGSPIGRRTRGPTPGHLPEIREAKLRLH